MQSHWQFINLDKLPQLKGILTLAESTGVLKFSPQSSEIQPEEEVSGYTVPSRHGFYAEDITGFYNPSTFKTYVQANWSNFKEAWDEFGFFSAFKFLSLIPPWTGWAWVVDSITTVRSDVVDQKIRAERSGKKKDEMNQKYKELCDAVTEEEILAELKKHHIKINNNLWVSTSDPTCIIYDNKAKPYALKDGWSAAQVGEILEEWCQELFRLKVKAKHIPDAPW